MATKGTRNYQITGNKTKGFAGKRRSISANIVEQAVWDKVESVLKAPGLFKKELAHLSNSTEQITKLDQQIEHQHQLILKHENHNQNLLQLMEGLDQKSANQIKNRFIENNLAATQAKHQIQELKKQKRSFENPKDIQKAFTKLANKMADQLSYLDDQTKAQICQQLIHKIILTDEHLHIILNIPNTNASALKNQNWNVSHSLGRERPSLQKHTRNA